MMFLHLLFLTLIASTHSVPFDPSQWIGAWQGDPEAQINLGEDHCVFEKNRFYIEQEGEGYYFYAKLDQSQPPSDTNLCTSLIGPLEITRNFARSSPSLFLNYDVDQDLIRIFKTISYGGEKPAIYRRVQPDAKVNTLAGNGAWKIELNFTQISCNLTCLPQENLIHVKKLNTIFEISWIWQSLAGCPPCHKAGSSYLNKVIPFWSTNFASWEIIIDADTQQEYYSWVGLNPRSDLYTYRVALSIRNETFSTSGLLNPPEKLFSSFRVTFAIIVGFIVLCIIIFWKVIQRMKAKKLQNSLNDNQIGSDRNETFLFTS